jgi:hypothetical protein
MKFPYFILIAGLFIALCFFIGYYQSSKEKVSVGSTSKIFWTSRELADTIPESDSLDLSPGHKATKGRIRVDDSLILISEDGGGNQVKILTNDIIIPHTPNDFKPEKGILYDTVKCYIQIYALINDGLSRGMESMPIHIVKAYAIRRVVKLNNSTPDGGIDPNYKYQEWEEYEPIVFLTPDKKYRYLNIWKPDGEQQIMYNNW